MSIKNNNNNNMNSIVEIFLPCLYNFETKPFIFNTFDSKAIGKVLYIDMKYNIKKRKQKKQKPSKYAFVKLQLYNTDMSYHFMDSITRQNECHIVYDETNNKSFLVKRFIKREDRFSYAGTITQDEKDFEDLENDIFLERISQYSSFVSLP